MAIKPEDIWRASEGDPFELHESSVAHGTVTGVPDLTDRGGDSERIVYADGTMYNWPATEYNPTLMGKEAIRVYNQMRLSDAQVKAGLRMVKSPVLTSHWHADPNLDVGTDTALHREQS